MPPRLCGAAAPLVSLDLTLQSSFRLTSRTFSSTTPQQRITKARYDMWQWLKTQGHRQFGPVRRGPSYLGPFKDQPFPANPLFRSQPVLSDQMKDAIYQKVMTDGDALKAVSEEMGVDVRRVAAVIRLKQVEKNWVKEGKKLATPYAKAVMGMLPQTYYNDGEMRTPHEPINDIPVHKLSVQQLFVPVSESRHFTREDAAKAFHETLLSADARSPQPELIAMERKVANGAKRDESLANFKKMAQTVEEEYAAKLAEEKRKEEAALRRLKTARYEFRIREINASDVGKDGKARNAVGWRYGAPHQDRKRGQVKIPTSVP